MDDRYLIAYDLGTSGTKASLFSVDGSLLCSVVEGYNIYFEKSGYSEQNANEWWNAIVCATRKLLEGKQAERVCAVSFSGQMMGCLLVDEDGEPLRNSIIWSDTRSKEEEAFLKKQLGEDFGYELLGHRISCNYSIEKLMWLKKHEPDIYKKAHKMLQAKDYIIFKMTGEFVTDYSDASGTNALDIKKMCWSDEILDAADIKHSLMPELHKSIDVAGTITAKASEELGLPAGVPVVIGGGDGPCATLGAGCIQNEQYYLTFGTSAWIAGTSKEVFLDKDKVLFSFAHVIPGCYMPTGTMQAAGDSYSYAKRTFCEQEVKEAKEKNIGVYDLLNKMIDQSPVGAKNLLYLPYLTGERSPRWNPLATGSFIGMTMQHTREDYLRAVIEGVAMNLAVILRAFHQYADIDRLILTGGGAKSDTVTKILSDVLRCEMIRPNHVEEATSMAAAVLAGVGTRVYNDFGDIQKYLRYGEPMLPDKDNSRYYEGRIKVFDDCYYALENIYPEILGQ